eukprot:scaffold79469_cov21-Tisochrysis_lutea.AAC.6
MRASGQGIHPERLQTRPDRTRPLGKDKQTRFHGFGRDVQIQAGENGMIHITPTLDWVASRPYVSFYMQGRREKRIHARQGYNDRSACKGMAERKVVDHMLPKRNVTINQAHIETNHASLAPTVVHIELHALVLSQWHHRRAIPPSPNVSMATCAHHGQALHALQQGRVHTHMIVKQLR